MPTCVEGGGPLLVFAGLLLRMVLPALNQTIVATALPKIVSADVAATLYDALGAAMHPIFVIGLPMMPVAFVARVLIERRELRRRVHEQPVEPARNLFDAVGDEFAGEPSAGDRVRLAVNEPHWRSGCWRAWLLRGSLPGGSWRDELLRVRRS